MIELKTMANWMYRVSMTKMRWHANGGAYHAERETEHHEKRDTGENDVGSERDIAYIRRGSERDHGDNERHACPEHLIDCLRRLSDGK